jgi:acetyl-CoA carboxylase carboxyl transferase subunit alpha
MSYVLPFEKPIVELEKRLSELKNFSENQDLDVSSEVQKMERKISEMKEKIYRKLSAWEKVQVARHPLRPYTRDYLGLIARSFTELHGDRLHRDDRAIIGGLAEIDGERFMVLGTQKGRDTKSNLECNFGCPFPEGYRKALRLMRLADRFNLPVLALIDTAGAFPGLEGEERHVAEAIAVNLRESFTFRVPMIAVVIGEGGSGGALGIGVVNRVLILEHAYYSVISPEGCAAILWKDRKYADKAAEALKITAQDLVKNGLADEIIPEPLGGAHRDVAGTADALKQAVLRHLAELRQLTPAQLIEDRYQKFRKMGPYGEEA